MKIANPIYDAAFKYLLEDTEIAKALIGKIIKEEVVEVSKYELLKKMAERLQRAAADEELLEKMELEDEVDSLIEKHLRENSELKEDIKTLENNLEEKEKALEILQQEKIEATKSLIQNTDLSNEQIALFQKLDVKTVRNIRKHLN